MEKVIWKPIPEYEGLYEVSNTGEVKSLPRLRGNGKGSYMTKEKIMKQTFTSTGYMKVELTKDGVRKSMKVHRLVCLAFLDNPENKPYVNHKNSNPKDNNLSNLEWCSPSENMIHAIKYGNRKKFDIPKDTLYDLYINQKKNCVDIAKMYGVSREVIEYRLEEYGIPKKPMGEAMSKYHIDIEFLKEELKTKSQSQIAREIGCDASLICHYVKKYLK